MVAAPDAPAVEVAAEVPAVVEPTEPVAEPEKPAASLLSTATTIEPPATEPVEPVEQVAEEAKPAVTYEPFTLPEGFVADPGSLQRYQDVASEHGLTQEAAQSLIDMHAAEIKRMAQAAAEQQQAVLADTRKEWVSEVRAELGPRFDTTLREAAFGRDAVLLNPAFGGSQALYDKFNQLIDFTGTGDNITFIRAFAAVGRALAEPRAPTIEARPAPQANVRGRAASRYPNMPGTNGAG